ncbi:hypothetical protein JHD53_04150 [Peptacetobacter hiranonis]|uniref:hypothetical protein n=1 Tax=Peptacetobacter hiranonis TaxID=89152 RepID=UPI0019178B45|nr:hypothetical protein [Peptacetobacter hiranonis]QQQ87283.1 hypothetical protein JHD53_04150 [Peptacetobacter hiranonis]
MSTNFEFKKPNFDNIKENMRWLKDKINLKREGNQPLKVAGIAFVILLIVSIIASSVRRQFLGGIGNVNMFSILLGLNLIGVRIRSNGMMMFSSSTINIGVIVLLLIPILALVVANLFIYRRKIESIDRCIIEALKVGFIYGLLLAITSMFSTTRINLGMGNIFGFGNNYIAIGYKFFPAFGNGFLIAFLTSVILNYRKEFHGEYYTTDIISDAVKEFLKLSLIILVITVIVVFTKNSTLYDFGLSDYSKGGAVIAYIMQMAAYLITIATGGIVHVGDSSSMSIFSIFNSATFTDTKLLIRIIFCVFAIAMIFVGANIYRNYRFENRKTVLHFSIAFGFLVGLVAKFSAISISGSMIQNMSSMDLAVRAGTFTTFVISILFTVVFTEIGYRVAPHLDDLFK